MNLNSLLKDAQSKDLQKTIPVVLHLVRGRGLDDIERWLKLELNGYWNSNPALTDDTEVPEYRQVVGQHFDDYGRPLVIPQNDLQFVNTTRVRWGVIELEQMQKKGGLYSIQDSYMIEVIKENMKVDVTRFTFDSRQLTAVLSTIKTELADRLSSIDGESGIVDSFPDTNDQVLELKPNFYGIGVDLRALARKWNKAISKYRK